jgi:hypothetical protein
VRRGHSKNITVDYDNRQVFKYVMLDVYSVRLEVYGWFRTNSIQPTVIWYDDRAMFMFQSAKDATAFVLRWV